MLATLRPRFSSLPSVIAAAAACATLTTATVAHADVVWVGSFETGDLSEWSFVAHGEYVEIQWELVAEGELGARVELHNDAVWPNGLKRVELQHLPEASRTVEGATTWFAWSFYLPEALPEEYDQAIGYWESNISYQQVMAFNVRGDDIVFATRRPSNVEQWQADDVVTPGVWHRIAMRVAWSTAQGSVSVWFDGQQVVDEATAQTLADENGCFVQIGLLRDAIEFDDMPVIVLDDAVEGDSIEDVRPDPPAVDGGDDSGSDDGGESTGGPSGGDTGEGGSGAGLDTSGGGGGGNGDAGPAEGTSGAPGSESSDGLALPPGFSDTGDAGASDGEQGSCQCRSGGSRRTDTAWGLVLLALLGMRRRLARRR